MADDIYFTQFEMNEVLAPPDPTIEYYTFNFFRSTNITLLMKLVILRHRDKNFLSLLEDHLMNNPDEINMQSSDLTTALHIAVWHQDIEVIKLLLRHKANPNLENDKGVTPLNYALSYHKSFDIVYILVQHGGHIDILKYHGLSEFISYLDVMITTYTYDDLTDAHDNEKEDELCRPYLELLEMVLYRQRGMHNRIKKANK